MALPFSYIGIGTYTNGSTVTAVNVPLSDRPDWFFVEDTTNWGAQSTAANPIFAEWKYGMAQGAFLALGQPSGTTTTVTTYASRGTSGGFTFIDASNPPLFASLVATSINDSTFVVLMTNTGSISVGDYVRVINPVGMLQIGGLVAQVTAVTVNTSITLGYVATGVAGLNVSGNASSALILKFYPDKFYPRALKIIDITQATQAKVYFAQQNDFTPGELVDFTIPSSYGMTQLSFLTGQPGGAARVLVVTNTATESSITINVDTTGYTPFLYPATGSVLGTNSPAICEPAGSGVVPLNGSPTVPVSPPGTNLVDAFDNRRQYYMNIGLSAVGVANATMTWVAMKADYNALSNA
jgi:hypothetical protein